MVAVVERLRHLEISWVAELETVVVRTEDRTEVEDTRCAAGAILDDGKLWLRAGLVGGEGDEESRFWELLAESLTSHLKDTFTGTTFSGRPQKTDLMVVINCWRTGPSGIQRCLAKLNVLDAAEERLAGAYEPGELVPTLYDDRYLENLLYCRFTFGELVAVERERTRALSRARACAGYGSLPAFGASRRARRRQAGSPASIRSGAATSRKATKKSSARPTRTSASTRSRGNLHGRSSCRRGRRARRCVGRCSERRHRSQGTRRGPRATSCCASSWVSWRSCWRSA